MIFVQKILLLLTHHSPVHHHRLLHLLLHLLYDELRNHHQVCVLGIVLGFRHMCLNKVFTKTRFSNHIGKGETGWGTSLQGGSCGQGAQDQRPQPLSSHL
jgi:hypothetical protein